MNSSLPLHRMESLIRIYDDIYNDDYDVSVLLSPPTEAVSMCQDLDLSRFRLARITHIKERPGNVNEYL